MYKKFNQNYKLPVKSYIKLNVCCCPYQAIAISAPSGPRIHGFLQVKKFNIHEIFKYFASSLLSNMDTIITC